MTDIKSLIARVDAENNPTHLTPPNDDYIRTAFMRRGSLLNECRNALQSQEDDWMAEFDKTLKRNQEIFDMGVKHAKQSQAPDAMQIAFSSEKSGKRYSFSTTSAFIMAFLRFEEEIIKSQSQGWQEKEVICKNCGK